MRLPFKIVLQHIFPSWVVVGFGNWFRRTYGIKHSRMDQVKFVEDSL